MAVNLYGKLLSLQYLRAVAALSVAVVHLQAPLERLGFDAWFPSVFGSGVDIFFVISGAVMWLSTANDNNITPGAFLLRRFYRIAPLYWIITIFIVSVMIIYPSAVNNGVLDFNHILSSIFFIPFEHPVLSDHFYPVFVPGWTINAEMFFYAIFAIALLAAPAARVAISATLLVLLVSIGAYFQPAGILSFYTSPFMLEFAFGLFIGRAFTTGLEVSARAASTLLAAGVAALIGYTCFEQAFAGVDRVFTWGIPAAFIVAGIMHLERTRYFPKLRTLEFLGSASYSIYMTHTIVLSACGFLLARIGSDLTPSTVQLVYVVLALASTTVVGVACYAWLEKPILDRLNRKTGRRGPRMSPAAGAGTYPIVPGHAIRESH